ncbi:MAG: A24 family peptidase [Polyangiales bacterium]
MNAAVTTAAGLALAVAAIAALCDWKQGEIPNWLTLPPIVLAPLLYGLAFGLGHAVHSVGAALLSGLVPYALFRRGAMGGGDVKLFAALGAITGFDLLAGIEIQLGAFVAATVFACGALAWSGVLLNSLGNALVHALNPVLPARWRRPACHALSQPVRLGGSILVATGLVAAPHLLAWGQR